MSVILFIWLGVIILKAAGGLNQVPWSVIFLMPILRFLIHLVILLILIGSGILFMMYVLIPLFEAYGH